MSEKTLFTALAIVAGVFFFVYLLGSFANASLDIETWHSGNRAMVSVFGGILAAGAGALFVIDKSK